MLPFKCVQCGQIEATRVLQTTPCSCGGTRVVVASDPECVELFARSMRHKMALSATKGRTGWRGVSQEEISRMLREHVEKGDPVDVANFCMMLSVRGKSITKAAEESWPCWSCHQPVSLEARAEFDGDCPHCKAELNLSEWPGPVALRTVQQLRDSGHSVIIWNPDEVGTASIDALEDIVIQRGNEYLEDMREGEDDE